MPRASGSSYQPNRQNVAPGQPVLQAPVSAPAPAVHLDRFVSAPRGQISGQVVQANWQPGAATRLVFINADREIARKEIATDSYGRFEAQLSPGGWLVYVEDAQGKPVFTRKIEVRANDSNEVLRLVSR
jgi:hypothetical protein